MCSGKHIPVIIQSEIIRTDIQLSKSRLHLNKLKLAFAKNISRYLESQQTSYRIVEDFSSQSVYNFIDVELRGLEESNIFLFKRKISIICTTDVKSTKYSENIRLKIELVKILH